MPPKMVSASGCTFFSSAASSMAPWHCVIQCRSNPNIGASRRPSSRLTSSSGYISISEATFTIFASNPWSASCCLIENQPIGYIS